MANVGRDLTGPSSGGAASVIPRGPAVRILLLNTGTILSTVPESAGRTGRTTDTGIPLGSGAACGLAVPAVPEVLVEKISRCLLAEVFCDELTTRFGNKPSTSCNKKYRTGLAVDSYLLPTSKSRDTKTRKKYKNPAPTSFRYCPLI